MKKFDYNLNVLNITNENEFGCEASSVSKTFSAVDDDEAIKESGKVLKAFNYLNATLYEVDSKENKTLVAWWSDGKVSKA